MFFSWGLLLWLNYDAPRSRSAGFNLEVPAYAWWFTQAKVLLMYLKLAVWPWPLSIHYEMPYLMTFGAAWPWLVPAVLLMVATVVLLWRCSAVGFVGAWVLLILSPTLVVPIVTEVAAERRMYLPLAALIALAVVGGYWQIRRLMQPSAAVGKRTVFDRRPQLIMGAAAVALAVVFSVASASRATEYNDPIQLWQSALASQPDNCVAQNNLGSALAQSGQTQEAISHFREALRLKPGYADAHYNFGLALVSSGQLQRAIEEYQQALLLRPSYAEAHGNLAVALATAGRSEEAIQQFRIALQQNPHQAKAHYNLGVALAREGRLSEAIEQYEQALSLKPNYTNVSALALAYADAGRDDEARSMVQKALELARARAIRLSAATRSLVEHGASSESRTARGIPFADKHRIAVMARANSDVHSHK